MVMKAALVWPMALLFVLLTASFVVSFAQTFPVGMRQMEYTDPKEPSRHLDFALFYPAAPTDAPPFKIPLFTNLHLYLNAAFAPQSGKRPLILLSHGRGSNGPYYAWLAEYLASHGYIVAALYHYRANTYDATAAYLANKLWQRPKDISLDITLLLKDKTWGLRIDPHRIGVAGHSQGGFTALWIGGATINPEKYLAFQRIWKNDVMVPPYLRKALPLDAGPALNVHDDRVKAVFAMAPGDLSAFGMDEDGLRNLKIPTYIIVGARDTQTTPKENAEFAAKNVPGAQLDVMPGLVDHNIFVNECDQIGRDVLPEACVDADGVDRPKWHSYIGDAALKFFDTHLPPR
jgi:predicted dienelactone hydrolase